MHNLYIQYLNSMNNANSSNDNAIAESQITSPFYDQIRVERELGEYLIELMKKEPTLILLTGHAGDGKTSLLHQVLRKLNLIKPQDVLKVKDTCQSSQINGPLLYIKDMSELTLEEQVEFLKDGIDNRNNGGSSIIISNTGPIIDAFKMLEERFSTNTTLDKIEMDILKMMDENTGNPDYIGDYKVVLINLARIDNTDLVPKMMENLLQPTLWSECETCPNTNSCPIYNNYKTIKSNETSIKIFVENFYRWLYETDKRLTIRQILAHLTYSITGNLDCGKLNPKNSDQHLFDYHFANLFFGYIGTNPSADALKIRAIQEIQSLKMDEKELPHNYDLFVKGNFGKLSESVRQLAENIWKKEMSLYSWGSFSLNDDDAPYLLRKSIRRMEMLFGMFTDEEYKNLLGNIFSPTYSTFLSIRNDKLGSREKRNVEQMLVRALNTLLVGNTDGINNDKYLYLPLTRSWDGNQNVQLLLGKVDEREISIVQSYIQSLFGSEKGYYRLEISFGKIKDRFPISLLLLDYFDKLSRGSVSTKLNPSLSHGVDKMKARLYKTYRFEEDEQNIKVLVQTLQGPKMVELEIYDNKLYID
ncbi:MAG: hypothetical protein ACE3JQ_03425 [Paenisporosarcina sp.]